MSSLTVNNSMEVNHLFTQKSIPGTLVCLKTARLIVSHIYEKETNTRGLGLKG